MLCGAFSNRYATTVSACYDKVNFGYLDRLDLKKHFPKDTPTCSKFCLGLCDLEYRQIDLLGLAATWRNGIMQFVSTVLLY